MFLRALAADPSFPQSVERVGNWTEAVVGVRQGYILWHHVLDFHPVLACVDGMLDARSHHARGHNGPAHDERDKQTDDQLQTMLACPAVVPPLTTVMPLLHGICNANGPLPSAVTHEKNLLLDPAWSS